ncbi:MAG: tetratricopeptide repeat protein [Nannocystaceae bacterium]
MRAGDERLTLLSDERGPPRRELEPGEVVGRYVVLGCLGRGGMGVVYTAYDPELDRKVALKLLLTVDADAGSRLQREAQAMAQLAHPNVVTIHDVGCHDDQVYLAMEFVDGLTLSEWIPAAKPGWRAILAVFVAAGEGLAAAHAAGLVHRDVKPENVMVGLDGRVRVMDFGLARADQPQPRRLTSKHPSLQHLSRSSVLSSALTEEGRLVGTPLYMAPEQWRGLATDARSDTFSFAVTLWEALYAEHPFASDSLAGVGVAVTEGLLRPPPARSAVPRWLRRVVTRGLATAPGERWPTMRAFVDALRDDPAPRRRRLMVGGAAVLSVIIGLGAWRLDRRARARACADDGASIAAIWGPDAAAELGQAMRASGASFAEASAASAATMLEAYAREWAATREETCADAQLRGLTPPALAKRVDACLGERRDDLDALVTSLRDADVGAVEGAVSAAAALQQPGSCADPKRLGAYEELPDHLDGEARALRQRLAASRALMRASRYDAAAAALEAIEASARGSGIPLLEVQAQLAAADVEERRGDYPAARAKLEAALLQAGRSGADELAAEAALSLTWITGVRLAQFELGHAYARLAEMWLERLDAAPGDLRWRRFHHVLASLLDEEADYEAAVRHQEEAIAIGEAALGREHPLVADSVNNLGLIHRSKGEPKRAREAFRRAVAIREAAFGPDHPFVATTLGNLGLAETDLGRYDEATAILKRSLEIRERVFGPDHVDVASALLNIAKVTFEAGDYAAALRDNLRALDIQARALGPEHPRVTANLYNVGVIQGELGDYEAAEAALRRTLDLQQATLDPAHPRLAMTIQALAELALERGDDLEARAQAERALPRLEASLGVEHPHVAGAVIVRAAALTRLGEHALAAAEARRALTILETKLGPEHPRLRGPLLIVAEAELGRGQAAAAAEAAVRALAVSTDRHARDRGAATARLLLARARWEDPSARAEAVRLAREGRALLAEDDRAAARLRVDLDTWLSEHPVPARG